MNLAPGEIVLREATRSFAVRADNATTLKGLLLGRRADGPEPVPALRGVTLRIAPGETVGMVGRNGSGKTSTLRVLAGIVPLESGEAGCGGRIVSLLELGGGFGREFSGRENIYLQGALYGFGKADIDERLDRIIAFSELGHFIEVPVKTYSAGMFVRLGFSIAAHLDADVLLIDEVLAVGDEAFQRKCLRRISERIASGATVVLVSHDAGAIERVCERVVVLDGGQVAFDGPTAEGLLHYHQLMGTDVGSGQAMRGAGNRGLEVLSLELRDHAGRTSSVFGNGSSLQVVIELRPRSGAAPRSLALELHSQEGARIFRTVTDVGAATELMFDVPSLPLLGGDYDVAVGPGEGPIERTARFSVAHEQGVEGVVDLGGSWRELAVTP